MGRRGRALVETRLRWEDHTARLIARFGRIRKAEEDADAGLWRADSFRFRVTKVLERRMARASSGIIILTSGEVDRTKAYENA
jgi:hypothetical protein